MFQNIVLSAGVNNTIQQDLRGRSLSHPGWGGRGGKPMYYIYDKEGVWPIMMYDNANDMISFCYLHKSWSDQCPDYNYNPPLSEEDCDAINWNTK